MLDRFKKWFQTATPDAPQAPSRIDVDGMSFGRVVAQPFGTWIGYSRELVIKVEEQAWPGKRLRLAQEIDVLRHLNGRGALCAPELVAHGKYEGRDYYVTRRLAQPKGLKGADVLLAFLELKGLGVVHGDLKRSNVATDGDLCVLLDFDQAILDASVASMSLDELGRYLAAHHDESNCTPLKKQLSQFNEDDCLVAGRLNLAKTTLLRKGVSTDSPTGIYHTLDEPTLFVEGERDLEGRRKVLDQIHVEGEAILDVGCNTGALTRYLAKRGARQVDGYEYSAETATMGQIINHCAGLSNASITAHDLSLHPISREYDTVFLFSVLHHIREMQHAIEQIRAHCSRIVIECRLVETGFQLKGDWARTNEWRFESVDAMVEFLERAFNFRHTKNHGVVDRERYILEFAK